MDLDDMVDCFNKKIKPPTTMVAAAVGPARPVGGEGASRACVSVPDPCHFGVDPDPRIHASN